MPFVGGTLYLIGLQLKLKRFKYTAYILTFQYFQVRTTAFGIVYRSNFVNHDVKYGALIHEYRKAQDMDQRILKPLLTSTSTKSPYCHVACAFRNESNSKANALDEVIYDEKMISLSQPKRDTIISFLRNVSEILYHFSILSVKST